MPWQLPPAHGHSPDRPQFAVHDTVPPQPSDAVPAHWLGGQGSGFGVHEQTLLVQVLGLVHVPQGSVPPQPSGMLPQFLP